MSENIIGLADNPQHLLEQCFSEIADAQMRELPFYQAQIPVRACGFQLFEQQWVGVLLTPWMLSLLVLPGPGQRWPHKAVGSRLGLALPCGNVGFIVGEVSGCAGYLASSLLSPLPAGLDGDAALRLAQQCARMALSLPVLDVDAPVNPSRRSLFSTHCAAFHA
ncbi:hydrogenase-2 assembly chaperone [Acerihabitans sp. TG2]|uniref:hydrogenase-2 assembly chaperone n=1 Tax=Acerihabitans sp. TG2 TaxID=3096008 RepID=UPI002B225E8C|nr:hydrogenase-2 assembly chaperone [Acerihabitans sp. TG2]MEA9391293.1 hydrogenase-2 assembly chaperone [Acerihabitans sp. TG2]